MDIIFTLILVGANVVIAYAALRQIQYIRTQNEPELVLQKISPEKYLLRNVGRDFAFNITLQIAGQKKSAATPLDTNEFYYLEIPWQAIGIEALEEESSNLIVTFESRNNREKTIKFNLYPDHMETYIGNQEGAVAGFRFNL